MRSWLRYGLLATITLIILFILFRKTGDVLPVLLHPKPSYLLGALLLTALFPVCMTARWLAVLGAAGYRIPFKRGMALTMAVWPLGTLTPSKSGDLAKAMGIRDQTPLSVGLGSVVMERALDVVLLATLSLLGALIVKDIQLGAAAACVLCAALAGWYLLARKWNLPVPPKWKDRFERFGETSRCLVRHPKFFLAAIIASGVNWFLSVWQTQLCFLAFGVHVPMLQILAALPLAIFVGLLPITIAGMGTRDKAMMVLLAAYAPQNVILSVGILYTLLGYLIPSLVGIPFMHKLLPKKSANLG